MATSWLGPAITETPLQHALEKEDGQFSGGTPDQKNVLLNSKRATTTLFNDLIGPCHELCS